MSENIPMSRALAYLWRHPRRTGFIALNIVVLVIFAAWAFFTADMAEEGLGGIPNVVLGYTGLALLGMVWVAAWVAWAYYVAMRHLRRAGTQQEVGTASPVRTGDP